MPDGRKFGENIPLIESPIDFQLFAIHSSNAALVRLLAITYMADVNGMAQESSPGPSPMTWVTPPPGPA